MLFLTVCSVKIKIVCFRLKVKMPYVNSDMVSYCGGLLPIKTRVLLKKVNIAR